MGTAHTRWPERDLERTELHRTGGATGAASAGHARSGRYNAAVISILSSPGCGYPDRGDAFSPGERYPETPFPKVSSRPNPVYAIVRQILADAGLDRERFGTAQWNPLGTRIREGSSVFVLCNFVYHRRPSENMQDLFAKCTHGSVLRAVLDYVLLATGSRGTVRFGNAPLQSCVWSRVLEETGAGEVLGFYRRQGAPVEARDLRLYVAERDVLGKVVRTERREEADAAREIDLGRDSLLSELSTGNGEPPRYRVSDYDPRRIEAFHAGGSHRYVIHRAILESDTVISLPKLKTHSKVGITCGLKGFVGTVGHKDCLAHYRAETPARGGDEYPDTRAVLVPVTMLHDWVNTRPPGAALQSMAQIVERNVRRTLGWVGLKGGGSWYGNDTAWRMTLDLARIAHYADGAGVLRSTPQRRHLLVIDGIVGGEGEGPLAPRPVDSGTILYSDHVVRGDRAAARLMGFDPDRIALLARAAGLPRYPLDEGGGDERVLVNGREVDERKIPPVLSRPFAAAQGWRGHVEASP